MRRAALSIAGSDSGGGAGIQADLRTMQRLGVFATTAVTAITAQNLAGVSDVGGTRPELLAAQIAAVLSGFDVRAIKTGMLWSAALVDIVADCLRNHAAPLVIDPVMVATSGAALLTDDAVAAYTHLWPRATLVTPNLDEAAVLLRRDVDRTALLDEAMRLRDRLHCAVLLKGGHLDGPPCDVLATLTDVHAWEHDRIADAVTHGSGCMLSAAITARLALGDMLADACAAALAFVHDALQRGAPWLADLESATIDPHHLRTRVPDARTEGS